MVIKNIKVKMLIPQLPTVEVFHGRSFEEIGKGLERLGVIHQLDNTTKFAITKKRENQMLVLNRILGGMQLLCSNGETDGMYEADYLLIFGLVDYCRHKHKVDPDGWYQYYEQGFLNLLPDEWKIA